MKPRVCSECGGPICRQNRIGVCKPCGHPRHAVKIKRHSYAECLRDVHACWKRRQRCGRVASHPHALLGRRAVLNHPVALPRSESHEHYAD